MCHLHSATFLLCSHGPWYSRIFLYRKKRSPDDRGTHGNDSRSNGGSSSKKKSPSKRSKQSPAALSVLSDEEMVSKLPPGPIDSPEEAQSEVGSLARVHMLDAEDYSYSLEDGIGKSGSFGPLFKKRSNEMGTEVPPPPTSYNDNLYGPGRNDDANDEESDFGDAADDATFSDFGKALSSPGTDSLGSKFNVGDVFDKSGSGSGHGYEKDAYGNSTPTNGADEFRQKNSLMDDLSPSTAGFTLSPAIKEEEPEEKPKEKPKKKKKKTFGGSARKKTSVPKRVEIGRSVEAVPPRLVHRRRRRAARGRSSNLGDLSIDGSAAAAKDAPDPLSPDADAWLYETISDVLGPDSVAGSTDEQSAKSGSSFSNSGKKKLSSFGKKKSSSRSSRGMKSPQAVPENDVPDEAPIPEPMVYTGGGDDKSVMTTVTKLEDAGMVQRECYAPAGKLGVVIDSTSKGPVVHEVKGGSPLEGIVFPGDRIIAIDGEDTRSLPASMVTKIMAAKKDKQRRMTMLSVVTGIDG